MFTLVLSSSSLGDGINKECTSREKELVSLILPTAVRMRFLFLRVRSWFD
jgi:hypothetical protein